MVVGAEIKNVDMENEQKNIYQEISTKLGVDAESIAKIESGELSLDDYANSYFSNYENNLKARIGKQIESEKTSEAFAKAYGKAEKTLSDLFGLDSNKYAEIDKSERFSTMVSDIKKMTDEKLKSFESADSQKLAQLTEQLNQANALLKQKETEKETAIAEIRNEIAAKENAAIVQKKRNELIESVKDARLTPKEMKAILNFEMTENGFNFEIDSTGEIWMTKDGTRVQNPKRATENLTFKTFFEMVAAENTFTALSKGTKTETPQIDFGKNPNTDKIAPQFLKFIQENGIG